LRTAPLAGALAALLGCAPAGDRSQPAPAATPSATPAASPMPVAGEFRTWKALLKEPRPVPLELWTRCVAAGAADREKLRATHGPHAQRFVRVYANAFAVDGLARQPPLLPTGAVIVKEKLTAADAAEPVGVAFMVKHKPTEFTDSGNWEFRFEPPGPDPAQTHRECAACHRASAASRDYVLGAY
jgi:hypothetical protein